MWLASEAHAAKEGDKPWVCPQAIEMWIHPEENESLAFLVAPFQVRDSALRVAQSGVD